MRPFSSQSLQLLPSERQSNAQQQFIFNKRLMTRQQNDEYKQPNLHTTSPQLTETLSPVLKPLAATFFSNISFLGAEE
jgi:hypothetical protein